MTDIATILTIIGIGGTVIGIQLKNTRCIGRIEGTLIGIKDRLNHYEEHH